VLLMGHGTSEGEEAKFNLVGPDLTAAQWGDLVKPISARLIFVNTTSGSFPFLRQIAGPGRVVITANDSPAQQFETVFPEFFVAAFQEAAADIDKNGRVSMWEAFNYVALGVQAWFDSRGQLATERPLLDDTGSGSPKEIRSLSSDALLAQMTYLQPEPQISTEDPRIADLARRRGDIESQIESLRRGRQGLSPEQYDQEMEQLLLELARIDRELRTVQSR
jgi:hypothetical protein